MTVYAKKFAKEFYGREPRLSYFIGASTGGGQGMHEAERFPEDYDGIVSELPAIGRIAIEASAFHRSQIDNRIRLAGKRAKILADGRRRIHGRQRRPFARRPLHPRSAAL
jgi:feruloyl esterase